MLAFGHSSSGILVGAAAVSLSVSSSAPVWFIILLTFAVGVLSHYIGDVIPHGHYDFRARELNIRSITIFSLDVFGASLLLMLLAYSKVGLGLELVILFAGIVGAQAPDIWDNLLELGIIPKSHFSEMHRKFHYQILHWHNQPESKLPGHARPFGWIDIWQFILLVLAIWVITNLPQK